MDFFQAEVLGKPGLFQPQVDHQLGFLPVVVFLEDEVEDGGGSLRIAHGPVPVLHRHA